MPCAGTDVAFYLIHALGGGPAFEETDRRDLHYDADDCAEERAEELERERRVMIQAVEERKAARNAASQEVARRKKAGEDATDLVSRGRAIGDEIGRLEREQGYDRLQRRHRVRAVTRQSFRQPRDACEPFDAASMTARPRAASASSSPTSPA